MAALEAEMADGERMMGEFEGRTALVTGGTKGIGRAIVRDLLEAGFNVLHGRSKRMWRRWPGIVRVWEGESWGWLPTSEIPRPASGCRQDRGRVRWPGPVLVNNAGVGKFAPIQEMSLEDWHVQIDTNLNGVFYLSRAAVPHLKESEDAWILNIGSLAGRNTFAGGAAYNASKFGLLG